METLCCHCGKDYSKKPNPNITRDFFILKENSLAWKATVEKFGVNIGDELEEFHDYWTAKNAGGKKLAWEKCKTFDLKKRLATWFKKSQEWSKFGVAVGGLSRTQTDRLNLRVTQFKQSLGRQPHEKIIEKWKEMLLKGDEI